MPTQPCSLCTSSPPGVPKGDVPWGSCLVLPSAGFFLSRLPGGGYAGCPAPSQPSPSSCFLSGLSLSLSLSRMRSQLFKEGTGRSSLSPSASRSHADADTCLWAGRAEDCSLPRLQHIGERERRVCLYESLGEPP